MSTGAMYNVSDIGWHEAYKRDETFDTPLPIYYEPKEVSMTNPTQRFFMVKVRSCTNCPFADNSARMDCLHDFQNESLASNRWIENVQRITPSCPMYPQSQETKTNV